MRSLFKNASVHHLIQFPWMLEILNLSLSFPEQRQLKIHFYVKSKYLM